VRGSGEPTRQTGSTDVHGSPGPVYHGERDLSRIADCAYMEALPRPGWSVEAVLSPLPEPEDFLPEGAVP